MKSPLATLALLIAVIIGTSSLMTRAGDLSPPPGPVLPTMKSLDQLEARVPVQSLAGNPEASHVIDSPGSYYLVSDLVGEPGLHGVVITADGVTLDLNGFSVTGNGGAESGIVVAGGGTRTGICVRNGTVQGWGFHGVWAGSNQGATTTVESSRFENLTLLDNAVHGLVGSHFSFVRSCLARNNGGVGISVNEGCLVDRCIASGNGTLGITCNLGSGTVLQCTAVDNGTIGISCNAGIVQGCVVRGNGTDGIFVSAGSLVLACTSASNSSGIHAAGSARILNCKVNGNSAQGILLGSDSLVSQCAVSSPVASVGIDVGSSSAVLGNLCTGGIGVQVNGSDNRIESNHASVATTGFDITGPGNLIVQNSATASTVNFALAPATEAGPVVPAGSATNPWSNLTD